jgi:hypothetical protein
MNVQETLNIMNSDFKLWERAKGTPGKDGAIIKQLDLPWGIGLTTVTMEGMNDAGKKREAVAQYGDYIRSLIRDRTDDEAVTSRAKQAAARSQLADSTDSDSVSADTGLRDEGVQAETVQGAGQAYSGNAGGIGGVREALVARRAEVVDELARIDRAIKAVGDL